MATNNATNNTPSNPVTIAQGGTNATSMATTDGVAYYDGTRIVVTGAGTAGQVLASGGAGVAPAYSSTAGGNLVLIQSQTASSSASINFTTGISATYNNYQFIYSNVVPATSTAVLNFNVSVNGGSTWVNTGYQGGFWSIPYNSATITNANSTTTIIISGPLSTTAGVGVNGYIYCNDVTNGSNMQVSGQNCFNGSTTGLGAVGWFSSTTGQTSVNGFQFIMSSGNISTGTFTLFGILE